MKAILKSATTKINFLQMFWNQNNAVSQNSCK